MAEKDPKMVGMYVFVADYIAGTRHLTLQRRGIYWDLLAFSGTFSGRGLPSDIHELCRLILPFETDPDKADELRQDLIFIINDKFKLINGRYFNERQHTEFLKSKELSLARSNARKKKVDTVLLEQKDHSAYNNNYNININNFNSMWKEISAKIRTRSSKPKSLERFLKLSIEDQKKVLKTYPVYHEQQGDYTKSLESWIYNQMYNEIDTPKTKEEIKEEKEKHELYMLKTRWEMSKRIGRPVQNMSQTEFDRAEEIFGKEEKKE